MKKIIKIASFALLIAVFCLVFSSCGVDYTDEEVIKEAEKLIEASFEINDIYFGKGLPVDCEDSEEAKKFAEENGLELESIQFLPVSEECPYKSIEDIKKATAKVYSAAYCEYLYSMAFEGYSDMDGAIAVFAKYIEGEDGTLTARIDLAESELPERTYDYSEMEVKSRKKDSVKISVPSSLDGKKEEDPVVFTLVKDENGWRLDNPTY